MTSRPNNKTKSQKKKERAGESSTERACVWLSWGCLGNRVCSLSALHLVWCDVTWPKKMGRVSKREAAYLFKYLLLANMCMYLEAEAVPALLIRVAEAFHMPSGQQ